MDHATQFNLALGWLILGGLGFAFIWWLMGTHFKDE